MSAPTVTISRNTFTTAQAPASSVGILAIVAASSTGTSNAPGGYARTDLAIDDYGYGALINFAGYNFSAAGKPTVLVKADTAYDGAMGTITKSFASGSQGVDGATPNADQVVAGSQINLGGG